MFEGKHERDPELVSSMFFTLDRRTLQINMPTPMCYS